QEDLLPQEFLNACPGVLAELFDLGARLADDHALLRVALHVNHGLNARRTGRFVESLDLDGTRVRQLLAQPQLKLLPDLFGYEKPDRTIRELLLVRVIIGALGQERPGFLKKLLNASAGTSRD